NITSDFQSIPDLLDRLYCAGISGEVTINIDFPNNISNIRFEIKAVPGTSDTSRLIIDGGNDTISIDANSTIKHLMLLDSAQYTTIQNFVLRSTNTEFGIGVILQNANHNIIKNNFIDLSTVTVIPITNAL